MNFSLLLIFYLLINKDDTIFFSFVVLRVFIAIANNDRNITCSGSGIFNLRKLIGEHAYKI